MSILRCSWTDWKLRFADTKVLALLRTNPYAILKHLTSEDVNYVLDIYHVIWFNHTFPSAWREAMPRTVAEPDKDLQPTSNMGQWNAFFKAYVAFYRLNEMYHSPPATTEFDWFFEHLTFEQFWTSPNLFFDVHTLNSPVCKRYLNIMKSIYAMHINWICYIHKECIVCMYFKHTSIYGWHNLDISFICRQYPFQIYNEGRSSISRILTG